MMMNGGNRSEKKYSNKKQQQTGKQKQLNYTPYVHTEFDKFSLRIFYTLSFNYFPQTCSRALQSSHSLCDWLSANSDQPITRRRRSEATPQWTVTQLANKV